MNRKKFLQLSTFGVSAVSLRITDPPTLPVIISTWESGMPVNAEAWKILGTNGNAIDAVEAGGIYMENTTSCCVGLSGYPDRDGIVTLDASIMDKDARCGAV